MIKSYYLFNASELERKDNTLKITMLAEEAPEENRVRFLPIEQVEELYAMTSLRLNSALLNFLGKSGVPLHFFDYYENYTGSFMPKTKLLSGKVHVEQVLAYSQNERRMSLARAFVDGAGGSMRRNLLYYQRKGADVTKNAEGIYELRKSISRCNNVAELMGIEGNMRQLYYNAFPEILKETEWVGRIKRPSTDPVNALISFGNSLLYSKIVGQLYHTQLLPTISFLHEPGERRFSLSLDISEPFKPIFVDRLVFRMFNRKELGENDFEQVDGAVFLKDKGRKKFLGAWEEMLGTTIMHRSLKRKVSYQRLLRLEAYKIIKDVLQMEPYQPFQIWW